MFATSSNEDEEDTDKEENIDHELKEAFKKINGKGGRLVKNAKRKQKEQSKKEQQKNKKKDSQLI